MMQRIRHLLVASLLRMPSAQPAAAEKSRDSIDTA
jgi:hypothetical protein